MDALLMDSLIFCEWLLIDLKYKYISDFLL